MCGSYPIGISASCLNVGGSRVERKECGAVFAAGVAAMHVFTCQTERTGLRKAGRPSSGVPLDDSRQGMEGDKAKRSAFSDQSRWLFP